MVRDFAGRQDLGIGVMKEGGKRVPGLHSSGAGCCIFGI